MHAVVTGGAGFIGSALVRKLVNSGHEVVVIDNLSSGRMENIRRFGNDIDFRCTDIRLKEKMKAALQHADVVFHLAAISSVPASIRDPHGTFDINLAGSLNVLEAAVLNGVSKVVFTSSAAIYGMAEPPLGESTTPDPRSPYAVSKLAVESLMSMYAKEHGVDTASLRLFNVYGPGQDAGSSYAVIPRFIQAAKHGEPITISGNGEQTRDFVYVDDVTEALLLATGVKSYGRSINIGTGCAASINELAADILRMTGSALPMKYTEPREGDVMRSCADVSLARDLLGWEAKWDISRGLETTVKWNGL